jgi:hypothetical protein
MTLVDALGEPITVPGVGERKAPHPGECWVLSKDEEDRGIVVVVRVRSSFVTAWIVTSESPMASFPTAVIHVPGVGRLEVWPESEFGVSMSALDRCLGFVLSPEQLRSILWSASKGTPQDGVEMCPHTDRPEALEALSSVCLQAWELGDNAWPKAEPDSGVFDTEVLQDNGITPSDLVPSPGGSAFRASRLFAGEVVPTEPEVGTVLSLMPPDTSAEDVLQPQADNDASVISFPDHKQRIGELRRKRHVSEDRARSMTWEMATSRAARQSNRDSLDAARARVDSALDQLLNEE